MNVSKRLQVAGYTGALSAGTRELFGLQDRVSIRKHGRNQLVYLLASAFAHDYFATLGITGDGYSLFYVLSDWIHHRDSELWKIFALPPTMAGAGFDNYRRLVATYPAEMSDLGRECTAVVVSALELVESEHEDLVNTYQPVNEFYSSAGAYMARLAGRASKLDKVEQELDSLGVVFERAFPFPNSLEATLQR